MTLDNLDQGDVVVRVAYSSVNFKDALAITGTGAVIRRYPCVAGIDLAGKVVASQDTRFVLGQEVLATGYGLGVSHDGGFAQLARLPGDWVVPLPQNLSLFDAMALGTAGFTAALALLRLEHMGLRPGRGPVVVTGATGGVGSLAINLLAQQGYEVVAVTGKPAQTANLLRWGAASVMPRPDVKALLPALAKARWAAAIDNVGGNTLPWLLGAVIPGGAVASVGNASTATFEGNVYPFILRGVSLLGIDSATCDAELRATVWNKLATTLRPTNLAEISRVIDLEQVPRACAELVNDNSTGRIVVRLVQTLRC